MAMTMIWLMYDMATLTVNMSHNSVSGELLFAIDVSCQIYNFLKYNNWFKLLKMSLNFCLVGAVIQYALLTKIGVIVQCIALIY